MQAPHKQKAQGIHILTGVLRTHYPDEHIVTVYEAAPHPRYVPRIQTLPLKQLPTATLSSISTLYVPPSAKSQPDQAMMLRLGFTLEDVYKDW